MKDTSRTKRTAANIKLSEASREPPIKKYKTTNLKQRTKEMKSKSGITGSDKIYSDNKKCSDAVTIRKVEGNIGNHGNSVMEYVLNIVTK